MGAFLKCYIIACLHGLQGDMKNRNGDVQQLEGEPPVRSVVRCIKNKITYRSDQYSNWCY